MQKKKGSEERGKVKGKCKVKGLNVLKKGKN
jgi:hypothetical protein